jgi:hypothetical protein
MRAELVSRLLCICAACIAKAIKPTAEAFAPCALARHDDAAPSDDHGMAQEIVSKAILRDESFVKLVETTDGDEYHPRCFIEEVVARFQLFIVTRQSLPYRAFCTFGLRKGGAAFYHIHTRSHSGVQCTCRSRRDSDSILRPERQVASRDNLF